MIDRSTQITETVILNEPHFTQSITDDRDWSNFNKCFWLASGFSISNKLKKWFLQRISMLIPTGYNDWLFRTWSAWETNCEVKRSSSKMTSRLHDLDFVISSVLSPRLIFQKLKLPWTKKVYKLKQTIFKKRKSFSKISFRKTKQTWFKNFWLKPI